MTKLTTPATASAPYTAEAPPVSTSTRSIRAAGIWLMSAGWRCARNTAGTAGLQALAVDQHQGALRTQAAQADRGGTVELMELPEVCSTATCGRFFSTSSVRTKPVCSMSVRLTLVIGLIDTSFGDCIRREPVTTTSSSCPARGGSGRCGLRKCDGAGALAAVAESESDRLSQRAIGIRHSFISPKFL